MSAVGPLLMVVTGLVLVGIAASVGLLVLARTGSGARQKRIAALVVGAATVVLAAGQEVGPRVLADRGWEGGECSDLPVEVSLSPAPVAWQVVSGGLDVSARLSADGIQTLADDLLAQSPLQDAVLELGEGDAQLRASVATPLGSLPLEVRLIPTIDTEGRLAMTTDEVTFAGFEVPSSLLELGASMGMPDLMDPNGQGLDSFTTASGCSLTQLPEEMPGEIVDLKVSTAGIEVRARL